MKTPTQPLIHDFAEKLALVTGAASGIGLATTQLLETRGARVVAEDINPVVNDMFRGQERIVPIVGDVATESAAQDAVALAVERFGRLDILVKNAASIVYKNAVEMTLSVLTSLSRMVDRIFLETAGHYGFRVTRPGGHCPTGPGFDSFP